MFDPSPKHRELAIQHFIGVHSPNVPVAVSYPNGWRVWLNGRNINNIGGNWENVVKVVPNAIPFHQLVNSHS